MNPAAPEGNKLAPVYTVAEAARWLSASPSTFRAWLQGRAYAVRGTTRRALPLFRRTAVQGKRLSFIDVVQLQVLQEIRKSFGIPLHRFRGALEFLERIAPGVPLLAHRNFCHDGRDLLFRMESRIVSLSEGGQVVNEGLEVKGFQRVRYGSDGYAQRLLLALGNSEMNSIVLDPRLASGRPSLAGPGTAVEVLVERVVAGETSKALAREFGTGLKAIEHALHWWKPRTRVLCNVPA